MHHQWPCHLRPSFQPKLQASYASCVEEVGPFPLHVVGLVDAQTLAGTGEAEAPIAREDLNDVGLPKRGLWLPRPRGRCAWMFWNSAVSSNDSTLLQLGSLCWGGWR